MHNVCDGYTPSCYPFHALPGFILYIATRVALSNGETERHETYDCAFMIEWCYACGCMLHVGTCATLMLRAVQSQNDPSRRSQWYLAA
eukprot:30558-Eustigmatos_ZCMA.PRE.1